VDWIDPAPAIARRVTDLVGAPIAGTGGTARAIFTSGACPSAALAAALARFGLRDAMQAAG
jgi:glutamate racemase